ncbi:MAG: lysophospholipid acyltransferase family protein [Candidatus Nanopelagicales bacterium]|nr:lysophospholipid acyltransferase family protein [Candidatus Nanopelagicales bacterium]
MLYYFLKHFVLGPWLKLLFRPWLEGGDNVPREGAAVLISNHLSFSDSIFLPLVLGRRVTFLAKSDYFTTRGIKGLLMRMFFAGTGQVPIDRSGGQASEAALNTGLRILREGHLLAFYPEGTRSLDGTLFRGRTGAARVALHAQVPVIPVGMIATYEAQPTGRILPKLRRVGVRIGKPLDFSRYYGMESDRFILRSVTDEMMYEMIQLTGQRYEDMYATDAKDAARAREQVPADEPRGPGEGGGGAAEDERDQGGSSASGS